jgi:hypothetical protein
VPLVYYQLTFNSVIMAKLQGRKDNIIALQITLARRKISLSRRRQPYRVARQRCLAADNANAPQDKLIPPQATLPRHPTTLSYRR